MSLPISGFTAVPNPQMLAFMAAQSFVMMMQAGEGWQYGKRKQSAMTNEEFNKQTPLTIMERQMSELKQAIPSIERSMSNMTPMVEMIVKQYGEFAALIVKEAPEIAKDFIKDVGGDVFAFADTGVTNQKTNQSQSGLNFAALLQQGQNIILSILKNGIGSPVISGPGPNPETPEEKRLADLIAKGEQDGFHNIDLITPPTSNIVRNPEYNPRLTTTPDPTAARKTSIAESGLSPLATAAVNKFKANIDAAVINLAVPVEELSNMSPSVKARSYGGRTQILQGRIKERTLKLSNLRIVFFKNYGYYY